MVFWFWVGLCVLAVPVIAFGLVMAALYLYARQKYMGALVRLFNKNEQARPAESRKRSMKWGWFW